MGKSNSKKTDIRLFYLFSFLIKFLKKKAFQKKYESYKPVNIRIIYQVILKCGAYFGWIIGILGRIFG